MIVSESNRVCSDKDLLRVRLGLRKSLTSTYRSKVKKEGGLFLVSTKTAKTVIERVVRIFGRVQLVIKKYLNYIIR